jgi:hypothetical protein
MHRPILPVCSGLLLCLCLLIGCGPGTATPAVTVVAEPSPTGSEVSAATEPAQPTEPPAAAGIEIATVTFARGLSEEMQPLDPGSDFGPGETVYLSVRIKGRPREGVLTARFFWREALIAEAGVDLADVNSGLLFSFGQDTYAGYSLTHDEPFPLSDRYEARLFAGDQALGAYAFRVVPPPEALPSRIREALLARGRTRTMTPSSRRRPLPRTRPSTWWGGATWGWPPGYRPTGSWPASWTGQAHAA